jgi:glycosyltransferase involved in cell wall biosynthesis
MKSSGIVVSYSGVHQTYQLALAAQEMDELKAFYCSLYDETGCWGARIGSFVGKSHCEGRRVDGIQLKKVIEFPWPLICKVICDRFYPRWRDNWLPFNSIFDIYVSGKLKQDSPRLFVGTSTNDLFSLKAAKRNGATVIHDCPGIHPIYERKLLEEAADRCGMTISSTTTPGGMELRKLREYDLADILLVYSGFHRKSFEHEGFPPEQIFESPLWVDSSLWYRDTPEYPGLLKPSNPLRLLFVGSVSLRKGIPFLLEAVANCGVEVELTIVGTPPLSSHPSLMAKTKNVRYFLPMSKQQLRHTYQQHDILVLPSVCDSFGFVALEAMACGLPVIMTDNCGAPAPDIRWKVPAMDSQLLAERILCYAHDREQIAKHGKIAMAFANAYTPWQYRTSIRGLFANLLNN